MISQFLIFLNKYLHFKLKVYNFIFIFVTYHEKISFYLVSLVRVTCV